MPRLRRLKIRKLFIANRGEIACRIVRAARELGIFTVQAFSDADAGSLPVRMCDEVAHIGPADPLKSYLNADVIIKTAKKMGCNAIHPGYGFLAENASFAEKCARAGILFVGPTPKNIREMGDKTVAKRLAIEAGIPVIPGTMSAIRNVDDARSIGTEMGYPCMLKAAAGGGGRGMRIVRSAKDLDLMFESAQHESMAAFGSDAIFLEKLIENARHIEVQILADGHGNVIHLGERDCTIQRRHQKLIEEAPSPVLDDDKRASIGEAARLLAMHADYLNAGTVEFLYDSTGQFFFMEMNTRIQVEHPVTEMVTGVDLIKRQITIAQGEPLDISQLDVRITGHSIECRINAEDPMRDFLPTPGRIEQIIFPQGLGVRVESSAFSGSYIPREYDSMIAKLVVHADTRDEAIQRMRRALLELKIGGVRSTKNIHFAIMNDPVYRSGDFNSTYIDKYLEKLKGDEFANPKIAAIAAAIESYMRTYKRLPETALKPVKPKGAWKLSGLNKPGF